MHKINRVGEENIAKNGLKMKIIEYYSSKNMTVCFEDGVIRKNIEYRQFLKGTVKHPGITIKQLPNMDRYIGQTNMALNGQKMEIIGGTSYKDLKIQFEDETIVEHKSYSSFLKGEIKNPNITDHRITKNAEKYIGKTSKSTCGQLMEIIEYFNSSNITVRFEDGTERKGVKINSFLSGAVENPNYTYINKKYEAQKEKYIGQKNKTTFGREIEIIDFINATDISIRFEDGTIQKTSVSAFKRGEIRHPLDEGTSVKKKNRDSRVGLRYQDKDGYWFEIVEYNGTEDILIKYDLDGLTVKTKWTIINKNKVMRPDAVKLRYKNMIVRQNNGLDAKCLEYIDSNTMKVIFEDGYIKEVKPLYFMRGKVGHDKLKRPQKGDFYGYYTWYRWTDENNNAYYLCENKETKERDIKTPQDILEENHIRTYL